MRDLDVLALAKAVSTAALKAARDGVEPGAYDVDLLVRVRGGIKVGEDYEQSLTQKVKPVDLWLATLDLLAEHVTESLIRRIAERAASGDAGRSIRREENLKAATESALALVREVTRSTCKGKVTTALTAETVEADVEAPRVTVRAD